MQWMYDSEALWEKLLLSPSAYVVLTATAMLEIMLLDPFYTRLGSVTSYNVFCVFLWCAESIIFQKSLWLVVVPHFKVIVSLLSSLQDATQRQNTPLWRLHITEDLQQKSDLSVGVSAQRTLQSWQQETKWQLSHWASLRAHPRMTKPWVRSWGVQVLGKLHRHHGVYICSRTGREGCMCWQCWVKRYWEFARKGTKYQKHETGKKVSERHG